MILEELKDKIDNISQENIILYFITRVLKPEIRRNSKVLNKYIFKLYKIDMNDEIQEHLHTLTKDQLEYLVKTKIKTTLQPYEVITDDTQQLFTYKITKEIAFADIINNQLNNKVTKINNLKDIILKEELWAYCIEFYNDLNTDKIYTFRKILASKIAVEEDNGNKKSLIPKYIRAVFDTKNKKLELIEGDTINLDKQIDCIYYNETFYIAKKTQFEQIIGLEDEYKEQALNVVSELKGTNMIDGLDYITEQIENNPAIHKKLVKLFKIGNYRTLDLQTINKMEEVCANHNEKLNVINGKILIENEKDIELTLKMLSDYYKRGEVSGKAYGTYAGKEIASVNED